MNKKNFTSIGLTVINFVAIIMIDSYNERK